MKILALDDHEGCLKIIEEFLRDSNSEIYTASSYDDAVALVGQHVFDDAIIDICLNDPDRDGAKFALELSRIQPDCRIHLLTGKENVKKLLPADLDYESLHGKPINRTDLRNAIYRQYDDSMRLCSRINKIENTLTDSVERIDCLELASQNTAIEVNQCRSDIMYAINRIDNLDNNIIRIGDENRMQNQLLHDQKETLNDMNQFLRSYPIKVSGVIAGLFSVVAAVLIAVFKF